MKNIDSIIRNIAFFISLSLYIVLLPIVLSYSLGYHIDFHKFKIYKTGILSLKSTPAGAFIYIDGKVYKDITPARIEGLKPGAYSVEVKREGFYPWQKDLAIKPNIVTKAENIILFPLSQDIRKVSSIATANFIVSEDTNQIYHMTKEGLYRSNMAGTNFRKISSYRDWPAYIVDKKFSPDAKKLMYFNENGIWVVYLKSDLPVNGIEAAEVEEVFKSPGQIKEAFWHSDSSHIVFVEGKDVDVIELGSQGRKDIVTLHKCRKVPNGFYYDKNSDSLYFNDSPEGEEHLYRLDLREKFFGKFMQRMKKELDIMYEQQ